MRANGGRRGRSRSSALEGGRRGFFAAVGAKTVLLGGGWEAGECRQSDIWLGARVWSLGRRPSVTVFLDFLATSTSVDGLGKLGLWIRSGRRDDANKGRSKQARARAHESGARADFLGNLKRQQRGVMPVDVCATHKPEARAHFYFQQQQARPLVAATTGRRGRRLHLARVMTQPGDEPLFAQRPRLLLRQAASAGPRRQCLAVPSNRRWRRMRNLANAIFLLHLHQAPARAVPWTCTSPARCANPHRAPWAILPRDPVRLRTTSASRVAASAVSPHVRQRC